MHEAGVIEQTDNADYNSPIFLVAKKLKEIASARYLEAVGLVAI